MFVCILPFGFHRVQGRYIFVGFLDTCCLQREKGGTADDSCLFLSMIPKDASRHFSAKDVIEVALKGKYVMQYETNRIPSKSFETGAMVSLKEK